MNTSNSSLVRQFADLNQISGIEAATHFSSGPLTRHSFSPEGSHEYSFGIAAEAVWAKTRGLVAMDDTPCLCRFGSERGASRSHRSYKNPECAASEGLGIMDHHRPYSFKPSDGSRRRPAVITYAPYMEWDSPSVASQVKEIATRFDLKVRVGYVSDVTYGAGTLPIVFWNPRVIELL